MLVQAFYQGGATLFDWTDVSHPIEIAFFDRGPTGGYWSTYWYNAVIVSSDEARFMGIHELVACPYLSQWAAPQTKVVWRCCRMRCWSYRRRSSSCSKQKPASSKGWAVLLGIASDSR